MKANGTGQPAMTEHRDKPQQSFWKKKKKSGRDKDHKSKEKKGKSRERVSPRHHVARAREVCFHEKQQLEQTEFCFSISR